MHQFVKKKRLTFGEKHSAKNIQKLHSPILGTATPYPTSHLLLTIAADLQKHSENEVNLYLRDAITAEAFSADKNVGVHLCSLLCARVFSLAKHTCLTRF